MKQIVVITGLAQGMGREAALLLAKSGDAIAGFDVDADGLKSLEAELKALGCDPLLKKVDITDRPAILKFRDETLEKYGHVDVVLSNVGIGYFGPFEEANLEGALKCMEINVIGTAAIFQAFLPSMRERRSGRLLAVSSLVGQVPFPFESIYSASKFAVEGLVQSMKYEVTPFGIKVALIQPAQVSTTFAAKIHKLPPEGSPYRDRVRRFIERDEVLIKTAPTPVEAAKEFVKVVKLKNPPLHNPIEKKSAALLALNKILPPRIRDEILINYMDIKP